MIILLILTCLTLNYKKKEQERYNEILQKFEEALIWEMDVTGLSKKVCEEGITKSGRTSSSYLIQQGYLKKEDIVGHK